MTPRHEDWLLRGVWATAWTVVLLWMTALVWGFGKLGGQW